MSAIDKEIEDAKDYLIRMLNGAVMRKNDRIAEFEADNAKLREALDKYRGQVDNEGNHSAADALAQEGGGA